MNADKISSNTPKKLVRSKDYRPIYSDELVEIKLKSQTVRLTFGITSQDDQPGDKETVVNESVTVVLPTVNFITSITHMIIPIINNEQVLKVLFDEYSNFAQQTKNQLEQLKNQKK